MATNNMLIVVGGATASGKTTFAIQLAKYFQCPILSADSRQYYKEMSIGTAKPSLKELDSAKHYFIDQLSIAEPYSVGDFEREALALLADLFKQHKVLILVGGSGLFINALCQGLNEFPEVPIPLKQSLDIWYQKNGLAALQNEVQAIDPIYYNRVDRYNPHRLLRALAVFKASGRPFSSFHSGAPKKRHFFPIYLWMTHPRALLYERINHRVELMIEAGLEEEVKRLLPYRHLNALQTVGYREWFPYFDGNLTRDEVIERIKQNTRRYAKRQLTWSRRDGFWKHLLPPFQSIHLDYVQTIIQHRYQWAITNLPAPQSGMQAHLLEWCSDDHLEGSIQMLHYKDQTLILDLGHYPLSARTQFFLWEEALLRFTEQNRWIASVNPIEFDPKLLSIAPVDDIDCCQQLRNQLPAGFNLNYFHFYG